MFRKFYVLILLLAVVWPARAAEDFRCASGRETDERLDALRSWTANRESAVYQPLGARPRHATVRMQDGMYLLEATEATTPFDKPTDLENSSLEFERSGTSSYRVSKRPLAYDAELGTRLRDGRSNWQFEQQRLNFEFPFGERSVTDIYISAFGGIYLSRPVVYDNDQYDTLDLVTNRAPVIAPLLKAGATSRTLVLYVKQAADSVTITWRSHVTGADTPNRFALMAHATDVQAVLFRDGRIRFSYARVPAYGAVVISTGSDAWRNETEEVASAEDPQSDVGGSAAADARAVVDLQRLTVRRVARTGLLQFQIQVSASADLAAIPDRQFAYLLRLSDGSRTDNMQFNLARTGTSLILPYGIRKRNSFATAVEGNTITIHMLQEMLSLRAGNWTVDVVAGVGNSGDTMRASLQVAPPPSSFASDLSSTASALELSMPVLEAFSLPTLQPNEVWAALKSSQGVTDDAIDGVAIYQTFYTDINLYATAYSTMGRTGAQGYTPEPLAAGRTPALLHLNRVGNYSDSGFLVNHELGHRWLYFLRIMENNQRSQVLNPDGGHPSQADHMPAAFPVVTASDYSVMGGSNFKDNGNGTFTTPRENGAFGYSWHELYLMGLASPEEAGEPWYYISNSSPALGLAYHPPNDTTYRGTRNNVSLQQVIDAIGTRTPGVENSQKTFRVLFVLLHRPGEPPSEEQIQALAKRRDETLQYFSVATGNRGRVTASAASATPPAIAALEPNTAAAGSPAFTLTVNGSGFAADAVVRWNGSNRTTAFRSTSQLQATITAADISAAGAAQVSVFSASTGASGSTSFAITGGAVSGVRVTALSPASITAGGGNLQLIVEGAGFSSSSVVRWDGTERRTTLVSASRLAAAILETDVAVAGTHAVSVGGSNVVAFTVRPSHQPALTRTLVPGFYIVEATLGADEPAGYWGMEVLTSLGQSAGGFNLGGGLAALNANPGFGAFALTTPQAVRATVNTQGTSSPVTLTIRNANRQPIGSPATGLSPLTSSASLQPGFYIVEVSNGAAADAAYQLALAANFFSGGVNTGGHIAPGVVGFGAFYVPETQNVTIRLFGRPTYGAAGAGALVLTLKDSNRNVIETVTR